MRMAVRVTVRGTSATSSVAPQTTHSATEHHCAKRRAPGVERVGEGGSGGERQGHPHQRERPPPEQHPELGLRVGHARRFAYRRGAWLFHSKDDDGGREPSHGRRSARTAARRAVDLHRQPAALRPLRGGRLRPPAPAPAAGGALVAGPVAPRGDDRPGRPRRRRRHRARRRIARHRRRRARPRGPAHRPGFTSDSFVGLRAFLTRRGRPSGPDQGLAHRSGHLRHGAARRRRRCRPGLPGGRARRSRQRARALVQYVGQRVPAGPGRDLRRRAQPDRARCTRSSRSPRSTPSTSCRARWPRSSACRSPACTAAAGPTGG